VFQIDARPIVAALRKAKGKLAKRVEDLEPVAYARLCQIWRAETSSGFALSRKVKVTIKVFPSSIKRLVTINLPSFPCLVLI
jgi:hypothetical protein